MSDHDQAAVEALCKIKYSYECSETDEHRTDLAIVNQDAAGSSREAAARAILDAIRAGRVPGVCMADPLVALRGAISALESSEKARADKAEKRLADYDARLTAVMAPDFKCWHQNSRDEWPEVAAWVINNLRQQIEVEKSHADKATAERDRLADALRGVTNAYRFRIDGQCRCGPIDPEIEAAIAALAEVGK